MIGQILRWLQPGLGVKRWLLLMVAGTALIGLGLAIVLLDMYRAYPDSNLLYYLSLRPFPRFLRAVILGGSGVGILLLAIWRLNRNLLAPYVRPGRPIVEVVAEHRRLGRGPHIVAIGGGTGLSTLLRGLKAHTTNLTAIVTMADDGGSSGRLRRSLGLLPPGDLRNCLAALSDDEQLLTHLFQYRFPQGELGGHSFGNLFIAALAGVTGSFEQGLLEAGRVLTVRGLVLPSTLEDVALIADKMPVQNVQAVRVRGESRIPELPGRIRRVHLEPNDPHAYPMAIRAILNAEMIVLGPGSLYTSVIPNLLVPDVVHAIRASKAFKVYVCNIAGQSGETDRYDCLDHVQAIEEHVGKDLFEIVLAHDGDSLGLPEGVHPVGAPDQSLNYGRVLADLADLEQPWRHDSARLAGKLVELLEERTGPLELPTLEEYEAPNSLN